MVLLLFGYPPKIDDFSSSTASRHARDGENKSRQSRNGARGVSQKLLPFVPFSGRMFGQRLTVDLVCGSRDSNKNNSAGERKRNGTIQRVPHTSRDSLCGHFPPIHFQTHTENKHVQKAKIPLFLFLAVVSAMAMAFSFARQSCCCCCSAAVCSFHTAAHIIFYFFHFSSPSIFDSCTHKHNTRTNAHTAMQRTLRSPPFSFNTTTMTDPKF